MGTPLLWIGFNVFVLIAVALDLGVFNRRLHKVEVREAFWSTTLWIAISVLFGLGVWHFSGYQRAIEYFTGYLIEKALSVDNLFLFLVIFRTFSVDERFQHRMLEWGILGALVMRGIMILAGAELIERFSWVMYIFGAFLVYAGIHMLFVKKNDVRPAESAFFRFANKHLRLTRDYHGEHFFVRNGGKTFCDAIVSGTARGGSDGHNAGDRFDSGHIWDYAGPVYRLYVQRLRDSRIAGDVFPAGGIFEPTAIFDDGAGVCAGVYRREDARRAVVTYRGAHLAVDRGWNFAGGGCGVTAVSRAREEVKLALAE